MKPGTINQRSTDQYHGVVVRIMAFNATFNNISVMSYLLVLLS